MPKENIHITFINIAQEIANLSYCERKKVGSIIVKDKNIISMGYNGTPHGFDNCCEIDDKTRKEVLHAESNAILKCARNGISCKDGTLYITMSPCFDCAKLIIQSGIISVYYLEKYRDTQGIEFLQLNGIEVIQLK